LKKTKKLIFVLLILTYAVGVLIGAIREINVSNETEMYDFLKTSVAGYDMGIKDSIKNVGTENAKTICFLALGGIFKGVSWLLGVVILVKGYMTGFSVMAAMRLYGLKGLFLCGANLLSVAIVIPSMAYFGKTVLGDLFLDKISKREYYKRFILMLVLLVIILSADCLLKGVLSSVFMRSFAK